MLLISLWSQINYNGILLPYWISADGRVRNRDGHIMSTRVHRGYVDVSLYHEGKNIHPRIHRLVAEAFIPNPDNLPEVNHIDGNKLNNKSRNLEWVTREGNIQHSWRIGIHKRLYGWDNPSTKYSEESIEKVCQLLEQGVTHNEILRLTGVGKGTIENIVQGNIWTRISSKYDIKKRNIRHIQNLDVKTIDEMLLHGYKPRFIIDRCMVYGMSKEQLKHSIKSRRRTLQRNGLL